VTVVKLSSVTLPDDESIEFKKYRSFPAINRGTCPQCASPIVALAGSGDKGLAFIASSNYKDAQVLPPSAMHLFYNRSVAEINDDLPKYRGYFRSQLAAFRLIGKKLPS